jgi:hypothetical protein
LIKSYFFLLSFFLLFVSITISSAQLIVKGKISDKQSAEPLPAANIQIENTLSGTISNEDGYFAIEIDKFPAVLLCSYIGYKSARVTIPNAQTTQIDIKLTPIILKGETIIVTAEDPAMQIMREVIKRKKIWRKNLSTYKAEAYTRLVLANDSGIVSISETVSDAYWDIEKGTREVVKSRRETKNISGKFLVGASGIPNFYDDDIEINGNQIIGVTNPMALKYYKFKLTGKRKIDDKTVFDIKVIPNTKLQPVFEGEIAVLDEDFALIDVNLVPGKSILYPPPINEWNMYYRQQFSNFGQDYWLPVDIRMSGDIKISFPGMEFPKIVYKQTSRLTEYEVNIDLPDSLYENKKEIVQDSASVAEDSVFALGKDVVPLSVAEDSAYQVIDSTDTFDKAFAPKGILADMVSITVGNSKKGKKKKGFNVLDYFSPWIWYNRVDEFHLGLKVRADIKNLNLSVGSAYNTGSYRWDYWADINYRFYKPLYIKFGARYEDYTNSDYSSANYPVYLTGLLPLFTLDDYFDYYRKTGFTVYSKISPGFWNLDFTLAYKNVLQSSVEKTSDFNLLFDKSHKQRPNPAIEDGRLQSVVFSVQYGNDYVPFGFVGQKRCKIRLEKSLGSSFDYLKYDFSLDWRFPTFLKRRFMPNALDIRIAAGGSSGQLPLTRFGSLDGNLYAFTPFAVFRSLAGRPYIGEQYAAAYVEHNFRTVPFELLGLKYLVKKGIGVIIFGAAGRTWISDERLRTMNFDFRYNRNYHTEAGFSINSIFSFMRTDFTWRIDRPGFYFGVSFARMF